MSTKIILDNSRINQSTGNTISLSGDTIIYGNITYPDNYSITSDRSLVNKLYVTNAISTGQTNTLIKHITGTTYLISNSDKNYSIYVDGISNTDIYIPDNVDSGLTFTTIRSIGAGTVNHIATGTSVLNSINNATDIQVENGAATWQYIGNSNWYGFGALGASSSGSTVTANNGLTKVGDNIRLGGTLTGSTTIEGGNASGLFLVNFDSFNITTTGASLYIGNGFTENISTNEGLLNLVAGDGVTITSTNGAGSSWVVAPQGAISGGESLLIEYPDINISADNFCKIGNQTNNNAIHQSISGTNITVFTGSSSTFSIKNGLNTIFSINESGGTSLNLGSDATNDIFYRKSNGNLDRLAAGTGNTVMMLNSAGTSLQYSKVGTNNIANNAVTYGKMQNTTGGTSILGRSPNSAGALAEIAASTNGHVLKRSGNSLVFGIVETVSFTVSTLPSASTAGQMIYVSNESGGAVIAFSDGTNWRRVTDRAIVS